MELGKILLFLLPLSIIAKAKPNQNASQVVDLPDGGEKSMPSWKERIKLTNWRSRFVTATSELHFLKATRAAVSFYEARRLCQEEGADLVMDNRGREWHDTLVGFIQTAFGDTNMGIWLGVSDPEQDGIWTWVDGTTMTGETFWHKGEPNRIGGREDCIRAEPGTNKYDWRWNDILCSTQGFFVCEKKYP